MLPDFEEIFDFLLILLIILGYIIIPLKVLSPPKPDIDKTEGKKTKSPPK